MPEIGFHVRSQFSDRCFLCALQSESGPPRPRIICIELYRRIAISLIVKREALPDQLRLRLQCPAFAQRDRIAPFKRSRNPMSVEVDSLATIRGRITTEPR